MAPKNRFDVDSSSDDEPARPLVVRRRLHLDDSNAAPDGPATDEAQPAENVSFMLSFDNFLQADEAMASDEEDDNGPDLGDALDIDFLEEVVDNVLKQTTAADTVQGAGKRLLITHIEVDNFKSYYGKHTLGPFHKNFTSIIGPNGSGKSNVIDSLLFVFAFNSQKTRAKKQAHMIHHSAAHSDCQMCAVTVHFVQMKTTVKDEPGTSERSHDYEKIPGSELSVRRVVQKNNSSRYFIDGVGVEKKVVVERLSSIGIDLEHNRFLILQGDVEKIAMKKAGGSNSPNGEEGMLEYIEDIVGSNRFKPYIDNVQTGLDRIADERLDLLERVKTAEGHKKEAEGPARQALKYFELKNQEHRINHKIDAIESYQVRQETEGLREARRAAKAKVDEAAEAIETTKKENKATKDRVNKLNSETERQKAQITASDKQFQEVSARFTAIKGENKEFKKTIEANNQQIAKMNVEIEKLRKAPKTQKQDTKRMEEQVTMKEQELEEANENLDKGRQRLQEESRPLQQQRDDLQKVVAPHQEAYDEASNRFVRKQRELDILTEEETKAVRMRDETSNDLLNAREKCTQLEKTLEAAKQRLPNAKSERDKAMANQQALGQRIAQLEKSLTANKEKVGEARHRQTTASTHNRQGDLIMNFKRENNYDGILGRLGDLGTVDPKYDAAISSTVAMLNHWVATEQHLGLKVTKLVRDNNAGRVSFIALDKIPPQNGWRTPANSFPLKRLFDLVTIHDNDPRARDAFYFAMGDLLVAENSEEGRRVAFGNPRYRVATLQGTFFDGGSGTVTGGGRPTTGLINTGKEGRPAEPTMPAHELENLDRQIAAEDNEMLDKRNNLRQAREIIEERTRDIQKLETTMTSSNHNLGTQNALVKELAEVLRKRELAVAESKADKVKADAITAEIAQLDAERNRRNAVLEDAQKEVANVEGEIKEIKERLVGAVEKRQKEIKSEITKLRKQIVDVEANERLNEGKIERNLNSIADLEKDRDTATDKLEANRELRANCEAEGNEIKTREVRLKEELTELEAELAAKQDDLREMSVKEDALKKEFDEQKLLYGEAVQRVKQSAKRLEGLIKRMETLGTKMTDLRPFHELHLSEESERAARQSVNAEVRGLMDEFNDADVTMTDEGEVTIADKETEENGEPMEEGGDVDEEGEGEEGGEKRAPRVDLDEVGTASLAEFESKPGDDYKMPTYTDEHIAAIPDFDAYINDLRQLVNKLSIRQGQINTKSQNAIDQYKKLNNKYLDCVAKLNEATASRDRLRSLQEKLRKKRLTEFFKGYRQISEQLKEMYQTITIGGDAELGLVDNMDPFAEGIEFSVRPPKKSWKAISNLSGGEKTLSSLALVFALHLYKPTPLYVMDEIDAALDFRNVSILAHYIKERTQNAQFIIISLRNNMFELADRLVGIYKTHDCTKSTIIDPHTICAKATPAPIRDHVDERRAIAAVEEREAELEEAADEAEPAVEEEANASADLFDDEEALNQSIADVTQ